MLADFFSLPLLLPPILDLLPVEWVSFSLELSLFALFIDDRESSVNDIGRVVDDDDDDDTVAAAVAGVLDVSKRALPQP